MTTTARHVRLALAGFAAMLFVACAALPDDAPVVENLDQETGLTIARLGHPLELYNETASKDVAERFAFLGPFETNQMGSRGLYLWVALPMENPAGSPAPTVFIDGAALNLGEGGTSAEFAGLRNSPYQIPTPWIANYYFRIDGDIVARLGAAVDLRIEVVDQSKRGPLDLKFSAQPGDDPRLPEFAAR
jgi:hypothetical protein